jgi:hypothetical protein
MQPFNTGNEHVNVIVPKIISQVKSLSPAKFSDLLWKAVDGVSPETVRPITPIVRVLAVSLVRFHKFSLNLWIKFKTRFENRK